MRTWLPLRSPVPAIVLLGLSVGLAGCFHSVRDERAALSDPSLRGTLEMESVAPHWNSAGLLRARCVLRNRTNEAAHIMVQVMFLDADGVVLPGNPPWENLIVPAYGQIQHERVAADTSAVDYRLSVRRGERH